MTGTITPNPILAEAVDAAHCSTRPASSPAGPAGGGAADLPPPQAESRRPDARPLARYHAALLILAIIVLAASRILAIDDQGRVVVPGLGLALPDTCFAKRLIGAGCPSCGLTRSFISIAHGRLRAAWSYNAASVLVFAFVAGQIPYRWFQLRRVLRGKPPWRCAAACTAIGWVILATLLGQWIVKLLDL